MSNQRLTLFFLILLFMCGSTTVIEGFFSVNCQLAALTGAEKPSETAKKVQPAAMKKVQLVQGYKESLETAREAQPAAAKGVQSTTGKEGHQSAAKKEVQPENDLQLVQGSEESFATRQVRSKIAILPFENLSGQYGAQSRVMTDIVGLLQKEFSIVPESQVESILTELRVRHTGFLTSGQINEIGKRLKVETLLLGIIDTYRQEPWPQVSFFCDLVSTKGNAPILWSKYFCAVGEQKVYILQRNNHITWPSVMQSVTEDLLHSLPKSKER